jgi:hypothetical protein
VVVAVLTGVVHVTVQGILVEPSTKVTPPTVGHRLESAYNASSIVSLSHALAVQSPLESPIVNVAQLAVALVRR